MKWLRLFLGLAAATTLCANSEIAPIDFPGASITQLSDINNQGQVTGYYVIGTAIRGFLFDRGVFSSINGPSATETRAFAINESGQIGGLYKSSTGEHGFLLNNGTFTTLDFPGAALTDVFGMNNTGSVVGAYAVGGAYHGYIYNGSTFSAINYPASTFSNAYGINDSGQIVGLYKTVLNGPNRGFLLSGGVFQQLTYPGADETVALGINNSGQITGFYMLGGVQHGWLLNNGIYTTIDHPGAALSATYKINDNGQIAGYYNMSGSTAYHGFIAGIPQSLTFVPITPCRLADTRNPIGPFGAPSLAAQSSRDFYIPSGTCSIPPTAQAYSLNVAVVPQSVLGFLTLWPAKQTQPFVATLNSDGRVKSNAAIVPAGLGGAVSVFATHNTDVVLDINGYFVSSAVSSGGLAFYPVSTCRISDTRNANGPFGGPFLAAQTSRTIPVPTSTCNIPGTAQAYSMNLAVVPRGPLGFLTAWPTGQIKPFVASLNASTGAVTSNAAIVPAGTNGSFDVFASNDTDVVVDINGYFAPKVAGGLSLYTAQPCRVYDSRLPTGAPPLTGSNDVNVIGSACTPPAAGQAYVFNATVVPPGPLGFLTLWPQGTSQPVAANLNASDGAITGNMAIVGTNNGFVSGYLPQPSHLVLDLFGYFAP